MKKTTLFFMLLASSPILYAEKPNKKNEYTPLEKGAYFSITNNNSQNFSLEEKRREITVSVQQPPVIIQNPPQQFPTHHNFYQSDPHHTNGNNNQFFPEPQNHIQMQQGSLDYFGPFYTKVKGIPTLFTAKNCLIALGVLACSYGIIYATLLYHVKNVKKNTGWGSFQEHIPPADLKSLDTLALADGIIEEIKARYPLINPTNLMPSILLFNKDIEHELDELTHFINFYSFIKTYRLTSFFPNQEKLTVKAQTKIQRLHIIRDAITEWINTHVNQLIRNQPIPKHTIFSTHSSETGILHDNHVIFGE